MCGRVVDRCPIVMATARTALGFRLPDDLPLVPILERQYPPRARILLEGRSHYRIGLDASLNQQTGLAGFAGVALWPGLGAVHLFAHSWNGAMLSAGLTEATALILVLDWISLHCTTTPPEVVELQVVTDRDSMVTDV